MKEVLRRELARYIHHVTFTISIATEPVSMSLASEPTTSTTDSGSQGTDLGPTATAVSEAKEGEDCTGEAAADHEVCVMVAPLTV